MPISIFDKLKRLCPTSITNYNPQPSTVRVAIGEPITTHDTFQVPFEIANGTSTETMNQTILGLPFSKNTTF